MLGDERELLGKKAGPILGWTETTLSFQFRFLWNSCRHNVTRDLRRTGAIAGPKNSWVGAKKVCFLISRLLLDLRG